MHLTTGSHLGPYDILAPIGAGGMGQVYRAHDTRLGRDVAIKVLPPAVADDPDRQRRFEQEARAVAALSHPNILTIHDVGRDGSVAFLVTELLEGQTLRQRFDEGALPVPDAIAILLQLVSGLAAAHGRGIVHRDLKPENVFLTSDGLVKILDFGLARMDPPVRSGASALTRAADTSPGTLLGTVGYMAPEQVRGQTVDGRADLFALGAMLYEAVTGRRAFAGPSPADTLSAILTAHPPAVSASVRLAPGDLDAVVRRCLEKDPGARMPSARDLRSALEAIGRALPGAGPRIAATPAPAVAVLPFTDMSPAQDQAYFCEGMAEEIINALARVDGLRVAARTSTFQFTARGQDVRQIAQALDVTTVLEGSVRTAGQRLRVTAQLVDALSGRAIWSDRYDGDMADVFDIQDRIASSIVPALKVKLLPAPAEAAARGTDNLEAYHQYLRGRHHRFSTYNLGEALVAFEHAVRLDPSYALAHVGVGFTVMVLGNYGYLPPEQAYARGCEAIDRALALEPSLSWAFTVRAYMLASYERKFEECWRLFDRAIALNPRDPDPYMFRAIIEGAVGDMAAAEADARRAQELDPYSAWVFAATGLSFMAMNDGRRARDLASRALDIRPDAVLAHFVGGCAATLLEDYAEAIRIFERGAELAGQATWMLSLLGGAYAHAGRTAEAEAVLARIDERAATQYVNPFWRAVITAALGRRHEALDDLASMVGTVNSNLTFLRMAIWRDLWPEPRYHELLRQVGLPPLPAGTPS
jgi:serine/threonine-protein kinase